MDINCETMNRHAVLTRIATPVISLEIRDNAIDEEGETFIASPNALLGAALSPIPNPSLGRAALSGWESYGRVGEVIFIPSRVPWQFVSGAGRFRTVTASYSPETFDSVLGRRCEWSQHELRHCSDIRNANIARILHQLAGEALDPGLGSAVFTEGLGLLLLVELARHFDNLHERPSPDGGLTAQQLRLIDDYLWTVTARHPSLTDLAALCGLGRRTFMRRSVLRPARPSAIGFRTG